MRTIFSKRHTDCVANSIRQQRPDSDRALDPRIFAFASLGYSEMIIKALIGHSKRGATQLYAHVPDPAAFAHTLAAVAQPGGLVFLSTCLALTSTTSNEVRGHCS